MYRSPFHIQAAVTMLKGWQQTSQGCKSGSDDPTKWAVKVTTAWPVVEETDVFLTDLKSAKKFPGLSQEIKTKIIHDDSQLWQFTMTVLHYLLCGIKISVTHTFFHTHMQTHIKKREKIEENNNICLRVWQYKNVKRNTMFWICKTESQIQSVHYTYIYLHYEKITSRVCFIIFIQIISQLKLILKEVWMASHQHLEQILNGCIRRLVTPSLKLINHTKHQKVR